MIRRVIAAAGIVVGMASAAWAAERATFIMTDGSRQSGLVVFHGSENNNIIDNHANLGDGQKERTFPIDQVAVIDFAGGEPSATEFQQMPAAGGNLLVLRSGAMQRGKLVNLVGGETVKWQNEAGQQQQYAIRDVSRIYLNPDAARRIYPQFAAVGTAGAHQAPAAAPAPAAASNEPVPPGSIRIPANVPWTSTNVRVRRGQQVIFHASGQVQISPDPSQVAGPDGNPQIHADNLPAGMGVGGLIGRVGNGQPFVIGGNGQPVSMPADGVLMLGVNDNNVNDNSGSFVVSLSSPMR